MRSNLGLLEMNIIFSGSTVKFTIYKFSQLMNMKNCRDYHGQIVKVESKLQPPIKGTNLLEKFFYDPSNKHQCMQRIVILCDRNPCVTLNFKHNIDKNIQINISRLVKTNFHLKFEDMADLINIVYLTSYGKKST